MGVFMFYKLVWTDSRGLIHERTFFRPPDAIGAFTDLDPGVKSKALTDDRGKTLTISDLIRASAYWDNVF
jgi:hypothetical protein